MLRVKGSWSSLTLAFLRILLVSGYHLPKIRERHNISLRVVR